MKTLRFLGAALALAFPLSLTACHTAHVAAHETGHVARKVVHGTGHAVHKVGSGVSHVGEKIEDHTR